MSDQDFLENILRYRVTRNYANAEEARGDAPSLTRPIYVTLNGNRYTHRLYPSGKLVQCAKMPI